MVNRERLEVSNVEEFDSHGVNKNDILYYARIMPTVGIFEILEIKIRTVAPTYFVGIDKDYRQAFLFGYNSLEKKVFKDRKLALNKVKQMESEYGF